MFLIHFQLNLFKNYIAQVVVLCSLWITLQMYKFKLAFILNQSRQLNTTLRDIEEWYALLQQIHTLYREFISRAKMSLVT